MSTMKIPLFKDKIQTSRILIGQDRYTFRFIWNNSLSFWSMDIKQGSDYLVRGKMLSGGTELINQYRIPLSNIYAINLANPNQELVLEDTGASSILVITSDLALTLLENSLT